MPPRLMRALPRVVLAALLAVPAASAEDPERRVRSFALADSNAARFALEETRRLLAQGDLDRALRVAQAGLDERPADLVLVEQRRESERWRPLGSVLEDLLLGLPATARARYDEVVRAAAEPLREQARLSGRLLPLVELDRRFAASTAGREALALLLEAAVERGALHEAEGLARRGLRSAPGDPGLWLRLVDVLADLGDAEGLAQLRPPAGLVAVTARGAVDVAERLQSARRSVPPPTPVEGRPAWGRAGPRPPVAVGSEAPAPGLRWTAPTDLTLRERDVARSWGLAENDEQADFELHLAGYRPLFPALSGRELYVSDGRSLRALDLLGGRELWSLAPASAPVPVLERGTTANGRTALDRPFAPTVWRDLVICSLEVERPYVPDVLMGQEISTYMPRRVLAAVDRATGRWVWASGTAPGDRERLADVTFAGEPVVADGLVLAVGARHRQMFDVALFGLEATTGRVRWERPLAHGHQETNLFGRPVKEFSAGIATAEHGVAYAATGLGCLAAVEVQTGALRWIASYEAQPLPRPESWYRAPLRIPRVGPVAPLPAGDLLVVAPGDAQHVLAFDRAQGSLRWRAALPGPFQTPFGSLAQVLGVARLDGRDVLLATGGRLVALDLSSGALRAATPFEPASSRVIGQGAIVGRHVLVPTESGLERFSLDARLERVGSVPWPEGARPGNLLVAGRVLVVDARDRVQGHYAWGDLEQELERRRRAEPRSAEVLLEAGELYLRARGPAAARPAFEAALGLAGTDAAVAARARLGLFLCWMSEGRPLAESGSETAAAAFTRALTFASTAAQRVEPRLALDGVLSAPADVARRIENLERLYEEAGDERASFESAEEPLPVRPLVLLRIARLNADARRGAAAVAALQRLLREQGHVLLGARSVRELARERIDAVLEAFGREAYAAEEAQARALLAASGGGSDAGPLERVLEEYPNASVVPAALASLAARRLEAGRPREAAELARRLLSRYRAASEAEPALALLAEAAERLGSAGLRRAALLALADGLSGRQVQVGGVALDAAAARAAAARGRAPAPTPYAGRLTERLSRPPPDEEVAVPVPVEVEPGEPPAPLALVAAGGQLEAFDLGGARPAFRLDDLRVQHAAFAMGTLVLAAPGELLGLDPGTGEVRWRRPQAEPVMDLVVSRGLLVAWISASGGARAARRLEGLEPATGETLWSAPLGTDQVHSLRSDGPRALLLRTRYEDGETRAWLLTLDALCGALLAERRLAPTRDLLLLDGGLGLEVRVGADGQRTAVGFDLDGPRTRFARALAGTEPVTGAVLHGGRVWLLRQDGRLESLSADDGAPAASVRLALPPEARAAPAPGSQLSVSEGRLVLLAAALRGAPPLIAFDLESGSAAWAARGQPFRRSDVQHLARLPGRWLVLRAGQGAEGERSLELSVVRDADGGLEQVLEPEPGPRGSVIALTAGAEGALVLTGAGLMLYGPPAEAEAPAPSAPSAPAGR